MNIDMHSKEMLEYLYQNPTDIQAWAVAFDTLEENGCFTKPNDRKLLECYLNRIRSYFYLTSEENGLSRAILFKKGKLTKPIKYKLLPEVYKILPFKAFFNAKVKRHYDLLFDYTSLYNQLRDIDLTCLLRFSRLVSKILQSKNPCKVLLEHEINYIVVWTQNNLSDNQTLRDYVYNCFVSRRDIKTFDKEFPK